VTGLLLVAAALTPAQRRAEFGGDHDLDEGGRNAATALAPGFARAGTWIAAPSRAARQTTAALGGTPDIAPELADVNYGNWTGRTLDQVDLTPWLTDPGHTPPGGESLTDVRRRAGAWLDAQAGRTLVAVANTTVVRAALAHALHLPPDGIWRLDIAPLTALPLTHRAGRWHLRLGPVS
jgi:broad specificity phosphatase PhoE